MSRFWSPFVHALTPYTPGEQPRHQNFIKLNTNENPFGPSPLALEGIRSVTDDGLRRYPDPSSVELRRAISATLGLEGDHVFIGNGSDEVLAHSFNAFFREKGTIHFPDVTYSFYRTYCSLYGLPFCEIPLDEAFRCDPSQYRGRSGGIVIANPNAPTGIAMKLKGIEEILERNTDIVVIVDEAYVDFGAQSAAELVPRYENLVVVQTFSKSRSLAGLRVGFAVAQPHLIDALVRVKDSFNSYPVGSLALAGALGAWSDQDWFDKTRRQVMVSRDRMAGALKELGFRVPLSAANFLFVSHERVPAEEILMELRSRGVLVRHFKQDRIRNWLRVSVGTPDECEKFLEAIADIVERVPTSNNIG